MKYQQLILLHLLLFILLVVPSTMGHEVQDIDKLDVDVTPKFKQSRFGPVQLNITKDSTMTSIGTIYDFTIRHGMIGKINITGFDVEFDGMEEYKFILHQEIFLDDIVPLRLGSRSQVISESGLRDGKILFSYVLGDLNDIDGFTNNHVEKIDEFSDTAKSLFHYSIDNRLEIRRATKQNGSISFNYDISSYLIPNIPTDAFHNELTLKTTVFPSVVQMQYTTAEDDEQQVFLILPVRLLPFYFAEPKDHSFNLTELPISIYLDLEFEKDDRDKQIGVSHNDNKGQDSKDPLLDNDRSKQYRIPTEIIDSQLLTITVSALNFEGSIDIIASVKIKAVFADKSLYARNDYPFAPNQYIIIMVFIVTVFTYKIVDYVDYRKYQQTLGYKKNDLIEEEFNR